MIKDTRDQVVTAWNKRSAPVVSDELIMKIAKEAGFYTDDSLAAEFPNGYAEVCRRTIVFARALLSAAPKMPEGWRAVTEKIRNSLGAGGAVGSAGAANAQLERKLGDPLLDAVEDGLAELEELAADPQHGEGE